MTDVAVDTLRIRGPYAHRLARVAARTLPGALERALADVGDLAVDSVTVLLDVDVDGCDDETLAVLWADAIRARLLATRRASRAQEPATARSRSDVGPPPPSQATPADVLAAARTWLGTARPRRTIPFSLLALGDPEVARAVIAAAGPGEWPAILTALSEVLEKPAQTSEVETTAGIVTAQPPTETASPVQPAAETASSTSEAPVAGRESPTPQGMETLAAIAQVADLVDARTRVVDTGALTRAAGIVLLYPWLADHCRQAQELHPDLDPVDVREAALAAIVDPDHRGLADDPLTRLLAGRPQPLSGEPHVRFPLPRQPEVAESAVRVLASFAALLPGFEHSTPAFVRAGWIARLGLLDTARNPALLVATTHPLDVMLPRLPYPIGLLKLPWSPPVSVRFRP